MSQQQPINILKRFKDFFACKNVLDLNYRYPRNIQKIFRLQNCLSSNPSKFSKYSKTLSPAELSQPQTIDILEIFKDFFDCKNFLAATHSYSEKIQILFRLQNCLSSKSSISWKLSKTFSPAKMSQQQPINILKRFKDFSACKNVLALNYRYPRNIQKIFRLQNCLSSNPSKFSKYSKTLSPAKLSQPQIIDILEVFKDFFGCKLVLAANHRYPGYIQRLFRLQNCLVANYRKTGNIQRLFRLQKFLSSNPSLF